MAYFTPGLPTGIVTDASSAGVTGSVKAYLAWLHIGWKAGPCRDIML